MPTAARRPGAGPRPPPIVWVPRPGNRKREPGYASLTADGSAQLVVGVEHVRPDVPGLLGERPSAWLTEERPPTTSAHCGAPCSAQHQPVLRGRPRSASLLRGRWRAGPSRTRQLLCRGAQLVFLRRRFYLARRLGHRGAPNAAPSDSSRRPTRCGWRVPWRTATPAGPTTAALDAPSRTTAWTRPECSRVASERSAHRTGGRPRRSPAHCPRQR